MFLPLNLAVNLKLLFKKKESLKMKANIEQGIQEQTSKTLEGLRALLPPLQHPARKGTTEDSPDSCVCGERRSCVPMAAFGQGDRMQRSHSQLKPGLFPFPSAVVEEPLMFGPTHDGLE